MLGKLLKYDFRANKLVLPFYGVSIALFGLVAFIFRTNIFMSENQLAQLAFGLLIFLAVISLVSVLMVSIICVALNFGKQTIGAQGPLMFALPITSDEFLLSKLISGIATIALSIAYLFSVIVLLIFAMASYSFSGSGSFYMVFGSSELVMQALPATIIMAALMVVAASAFTMLIYFCAVAISGYITQNRVVGTVVAYVGISFVLQIIMFVFSAIFHFLFLMATILRGSCKAMVTAQSLHCFALR